MHLEKKYQNLLESLDLKLENLAEESRSQVNIGKVSPKSPTKKKQLSNSIKKVKNSIILVQDSVASPFLNPLRWRR